MDEIIAQARVIAALAGTIRSNDWMDDILTKCGQIEKALQIIRSEAEKRRGGDR